jgi:hypothetical protein
LSNLLEGIKAIILKDADSNTWRVYANSESGTDWQELGFASPPYDEASEHHDGIVTDDRGIGVAQMQHTPS